MAKRERGDDSRLKRKLFWRVLGMALGAFAIIFGFYIFFWKGVGGDIVVRILERFFGFPSDEAYFVYHYYVRNNAELIWLAAVVGMFFILFRVFLGWFTRYFREINRGIDGLLGREEITLIPELATTEKQLNAVRQTLERRSLETQLAEQRKDELVMYLAHDIRTPLTSVIGYLSLLDEAQDMPAAQRAKYLHITLEKAHRLEQLIGEFFEITRYNSRQMLLECRGIDLSYMLAQVADELYPQLSARGNTVRLEAAENLTIYGDPDKLARVFNNLLKNAASYSDERTEILIRAERTGRGTAVTVRNEGRTIPPEKLAVIFDKFYRLDEARRSDTGGSGLGLAIAKEIVELHGGTISVRSESGVTAFTVVLPDRETGVQSRAE